MITNLSSTGYFTSRHEIIEWINDLLISHLTRIQQLGSGNIYCQLLDAAYPQKVPLNKVKWQAYLETDFLHNFKILQTTLQRLGINKYIDIQKLAKAKYQDNLQFAQWMRFYLSPKIKKNGVYNAVSRRNNQQISLLFVEKKNFDLKETIIVYKESERQQLRELREIKQNKMINSVSSQMLSPALKTCKSTVGFVLGLNSVDKTSTAKKNENKKLQRKENIKVATKTLTTKQIIKSTTKLRPQINTKTKVLKQKAVIKAVEMIQSDEEQCF